MSKPDNGCMVCGRPPEAHKTMRHEYMNPHTKTAVLRARDDEGESSSQHDPSSQGPVRNLLGGDPVLRIVLMRKGLISEQDLTDVENELRTAGIAVAQPLGQSRDR